MKELKEDKTKLEKELLEIIRKFEEKYGVEIYDIVISHERTIGGDVRAIGVGTDIRI